MKNLVTSFMRKTIKDQSGQVLPIAAVSLVALLSLGGLSMDFGRAYIAQARLQSYANAAALAAAGVVYNTSTTNGATKYANDYSASTGDNNAISYMGTVSTTVTTKCLNMLLPSGNTCTSSSPANAVQVTETASVPTTFMSLLGKKTMNIAAVATASMQGVAQPWNVAVVIDSTGSMASQDSNCSNLTEFQCALTGVQGLLANVNPCPGGATTCGQQSNGSSSGPTANFAVSLFTFPNVLTAYNGNAVNSLSDDINCNGTPATWQNYSSQPIAAPYTLPVPGATLPTATSSTPGLKTGMVYMTYTETSAGTNPGKTWTATYQITPFLSDYYSPSSTGGLNSSSDIVKAVGYGSTDGCLTYTFGIWGTGSGSHFGNTYLASTIYEAQAALTAEQAARPGSKNAIIFLSDGQANASYYSKNSSTYGSTVQGSDAYEFPMGPAAGGSLPYGSEVGPHVSNDPVPAYYTPANAPTSYAYNALGVNGKGLYPDWYDQCQQAIKAAQYASGNGTTVFSVAYGSGDSGCNSGWLTGLTDTTLVATGKNVGFTLSGLTPCVTMENIADSLSDFYSDYNQSGSGSTCQDDSHTVTSLQDIFLAIASTFTTPRLVPNNAAGTVVSTSN